MVKPIPNKKYKHNFHFHVNETLFKQNKQWSSFVNWSITLLTIVIFII